MDWNEINVIAATLGTTNEQRRQWKSRGSVAHPWRLPIAREAERLGIKFTDSDFEGQFNDPATEASVA